MMIIECKKAKSPETMDFWCDQAILQIIEKKYAEKQDGFHTVLCYGISFFKKTAKIKLMR